MEKSNVSIKSNIYPIKGAVKPDPLFLSKVFDSKALIKLNAASGYNYNRGFSEIQRKIFDNASKCYYNKAGDYTWGSVLKNGELVWICRCIKQDCYMFSSCRPDFDESELECLKYIEAKASEPETIELISGDFGQSDKDSMTDEFEKQSMPANNERNDNKNNETDSLEIESNQAVNEPASVKIKEPNESDATETKHSNPANVLKGQESIIQADIDTRMLVNAGPGTGKTYSLLERLKYLVSNYNMNPQDDILVLCFSRAAVAEIKNRLKKAVENGEADYSLIGTEIRTFDSFATYLLAQLDRNFEGYDYDHRIQMAIQTINECSGLFDNMRHFIVDEIQDLVGIRARMVQSILEECTCGFTLLGDSCQAIYDYDVDRLNGEIDSVAFYNWLHEHFEDDLVLVELESNKRQTASLAVATDRLRQCILQNQDSMGRARLEEVLSSADNIGSARKLKYQDIAGHKTISFLCRSNGEALKLSSYFRSNSIDHYIQTLSSNSCLSSWIGSIFGDWDVDVIDFDDFKQRHLSILPNSLDTDIKERWDILKSVENGSSSRMSVGDLINNIQKDRLATNDLYTHPACEVAVSTIHKAKGREYDSVVLLEEPIERFIHNEEPEEKAIQELKTYYVAATRPRKKILRIGLGKARLNKPKGRIDRWFETGYNINTVMKRPTHVEVGKEHDVDKNGFVSNKLGSESVIIANQKYIRENVKMGDELVLRKVIDDSQNFGVGYEIYHIGVMGTRKVGYMSSTFVSQINEIMRYCKNIRAPIIYPEIYPREIQKIYVDQTISYVSGTNLVNIGSIYKRTKAWNGFSITGFGYLYNEYDW